MDVLVSRIRRTLTAQERAAAFEHTNKVASETAEEERRLREQRANASGSSGPRLRTLRQNVPSAELAPIAHVPRRISESSMDQISIGKPSNDAIARIGTRLKESRVAKGYSLDDLAIATGLTDAEISAIEDGTSDDAHHIQRIEHALS